MQFSIFLKKASRKAEGKKLIRSLLFKYKHKFTIEDFALLEYVFCEKLTKWNICNKHLHITEPTYYNHLKNAICKFEGVISDVEYREITKIA